MKLSRLTISLVVSAGVLLPAASLLQHHLVRRSLRTMVSGSLALDDSVRVTPRPTSERGKAEARRRIANGSAGTYIAEILLDNDSSLAHWQARRDKPVRVFIDEAAQLGDWNPAFASQVRSAFQEWSSTGIPVRFTFVEKKRDADVAVQFITKFGEPISGKTVWTRNDAWWIVDGKVTIALRRSTGDVLSESAIHAIALHEVGHLLGLDHAKNDANIMAARVRVKTLSDADRATIQLLYSLEPGSLK